MNIFRRKQQNRMGTEEALSRKSITEVMDTIEHGNFPKNEVKHFQFFVVHTTEARTEEIPAIIGKVVDACHAEGLAFSEISSSLVVGYLGLLNPETDSVQLRLKLVNDLLSRHGSLIRIAHGEDEGPAGPIGTKRRWTYGAVVPKFSEVLKKLFATPFGTAIEIP